MRIYHIPFEPSRIPFWYFPVIGHLFSIISMVPGVDLTVMPNICN